MFRISRAIAVVVLTAGVCTVGAGAAGAAKVRTVKAFGMVIAVNGSTSDTACGSAGVAGNYTVMARNTSQTIVYVKTTTHFHGRGLPNATFANVCVNEMVGATGRVVSGQFSANDVRIWSPRPPKARSAFGMVISVNGNTADGACGQSGQGGTFTVLGRNTSQTVVNVTPATGFFGRNLTSPTFANVCVDEMVGATGTVSNGSFSATNVMIWSPVPDDFHSFGMVISVNNSNASTACGQSGQGGTFTVMRRNASQTIINVTPTTTFHHNGVASATFADVCVNEMAGATGSVSGGALNASKVHIWSRPGTPTVVTDGMVISVDGNTAAGACGHSGQGGTFTVMRRNASQTIVNVTPTTRFREAGVKGLTYSIVCVNEMARAAGTVSGTALNATDVHVWSPPGSP